MKFLGIEISKNLLIGIIVGVLVVGGITTGVILMNNTKDNQKQEEKQKDTIVLKDDLKFEINSEVNLLSLVSEDNKVKVLSEDETIDTSTLGEKEITITYEVEKTEEEKNFTITIVDTQAPTIEYKKELSTNVGTKIDLLKDVKVSDNSKEEIKATIEGDYNFDNEGTYNLKYIAVDSSNNKKEEEFTLKVNKKPTCNLASGTITQTKPSNLCQYTTKTISWCWQEKTNDDGTTTWIWGIAGNSGWEDPNELYTTSLKPYLFTKPKETYNDGEYHFKDVVVYIIK